MKTENVSDSTQPWVQSIIPFWESSDQLINGRTGFIHPKIPWNHPVIPIPHGGFRGKSLCFRTLRINKALTFRNFTDNQKSWTATTSFPFCHLCPSQVSCLDQMDQGKPMCMHCNVRAPAAVRNCSKVLSQPAPPPSVESRRWAQLCQILWARGEKNRAPKLILPPTAGRTLELVPAPDPQGQMNVISEKQNKLVLYDQQALFMEAFSSEIKWTIPIAYCKNKRREQ